MKKYILMAAVFVTGCGTIDVGGDTIDIAKLINGQPAITPRTDSQYFNGEKIR